MYLRQPGLGIWVLASLFVFEFGQDWLVASCFLAVVANAVVFLHSANERLRRGNQARYRIADSAGAVGIGSHIPFEDIAIARVRKAHTSSTALDLEKVQSPRMASAAF